MASIANTIAHPWLLPPPAMNLLYIPLCRSYYMLYLDGRDLQLIFDWGQQNQLKDKRRKQNVKRQERSFKTGEEIGYLIFSEVV